MLQIIVFIIMSNTSLLFNYKNFYKFELTRKDQCNNSRERILLRINISLVTFFFFFFGLVSLATKLLKDGLSQKKKKKV